MGRGEITDALESFFHFQKVEGERIDQLLFRSILIVAGEKDIDFIGNGKSLFKLNIKGFKKY